MDNDYRARRIQRWIGSPETGDLNDTLTIEELERDIVGLGEYLRKHGLTSVGNKPVEGESLTGLRYSTKKFQSPNQSGSLQPKGIVFHHSCGELASNISWLLQKRSQVSYHIIIGTDGRRYQFVPFWKKAWHAGSSYFRGRKSCNSFMLGVAFTGSTYDRELTDDEISSAVDFVKQHKDKYGWTIDWMTDHRTVSPNRKNDLNPVEFQRLRNALKSIF